MRSQLFRWSREISLVLATGGLLVLSFPPFNVDGFAWIALVPLLLVLTRQPARRAFALSHLAGVLFFSGLFSWIWTIRSFNLVDYTLLGLLYLPLYLSLWGAGVTWMRTVTGLPILCIAPPLWVTLEYLRSNVSFLSFPWMLLGVSQARHPWLIQIASFTGVYGLSFLIVGVNTVLASLLTYEGRLTDGWRILIKKNAWAVLSAVVVAAMMTSTIVYGTFVISDHHSGSTVAVSIVQGNIPLEHRWDKTNRMEILERQDRLTRFARESKPQLVVWPETAVPGDPVRDSELRAILARTARDMHSGLLVGSAVVEKFANRVDDAVKTYNSMILFSENGDIIGQYRKMVLVPFGEYEPLKGSVHWPQAIAAKLGAMHAGEEYTVFHYGDAAFGSIVCWETIFPDHVRQFVKRGAEFMVSATNEAWFGDTAVPYEMLSMTIFRAVENHVSIARAANIGLSALIDPYGRIVRLVEGHNGKDIFMEGVLSGHIARSTGGTFYTHYGDVFAFMQIFVCISLIGHACWIRLRAPLAAAWRKDTAQRWHLIR